MRHPARQDRLPDHRDVVGRGQPPLSAPGPESEIIYDGGCPVCRGAVHRLKPRHGGPQIALTDARAAPDRVAMLAARGLDLDEGIVVRTGESYLHGAEATRYLAGLHASAGWLERAVAWSFGSRRRAALAYPVFRAFRRLLLFVLGRRPL